MFISIIINVIIKAKVKVKKKARTSHQNENKPRLNKKMNEGNFDIVSKIVQEY